MSVRESTQPVGSGFDAAQARTWIVAGALPRTWARSSIGSPSTRVSPVTATSSPMSVTVPSTTLDTATPHPAVGDEAHPYAVLGAFLDPARDEREDCPRCYR